MTAYSTNFDYTEPFSDTGFQLGLLATTVASYTIPGTPDKLYRAEFTYPYNANVWVGYNVTPTVPTEGTVSAVRNIVLNPKLKYVRGGDVLNFISGGAVTDMGIELFTLPN
jgi:hypothetical protein